MVDLSYPDLGIVSLLIAASVALAIFERLNLTQDIVVSCLRAFAQLTAVGIVLGALFRNVALHWVILVLAVMIGAAVQAAVGRVESPLSGIVFYLTFSIGLTSIVTLAFVIGAVIRPPVWYDPQFVIPLAGMTVGNCMISVALAASRFGSDLRSRQDEVEALLALGATREQAVAPVVRDAIRAAMIPSIAGMMIVGIVSLPGMMTGQILAGRDPGEAVRYQIVVQYMLMFAAIVASSLQVRLTRRKYFTAAHQLRRDLLQGTPVTHRTRRRLPWRR